jgi:hypothetical protein
MQRVCSLAWLFSAVYMWLVRARGCACEGYLACITALTHLQHTHSHSTHTLLATSTPHHACTPSYPGPLSHILNRNAHPRAVLAVCAALQERRLEDVAVVPRQNITDPEELAEFRLKQRQHFEDAIRKNRWAVQLSLSLQAGGGVRRVHGRGHGQYQAQGQAVPGSGSGSDGWSRWVRL